MFRVRLALIGMVSIALLGVLLPLRLGGRPWGRARWQWRWATCSCACGIVYFGGVFRLPTR